MVGRWGVQRAEYISVWGPVDEGYQRTTSTSPRTGRCESPSSQLESSNINPAVNCYLHNSCAGNESSHGLAGGQLWLWPMSGWGETLWLLPNILWFSSSSSHYWPAASDTLTRWRHTRTSGRGRAVWEGWIIILLYHLPYTSPSQYTKEQTLQHPE